MTAATVNVGTIRGSYAVGGTRESARRVRGQGTHLTARGRLAVAVSALALVAVAVVSLMGMMSPAGASTAITVESGMTLTEIATQHMPEVPLDEAIVDLQRANRLNSPELAVGQELVIPAP